MEPIDSKALSSGETDTTRTTGLLWPEMERSNRGPKPKLTAKRIAAAAIEIADAEGLAAVSMQRVAAAFGFTTMALYRYVPSKAVLIALMFDVAMGPPPRDQGRGWREGLLAWSREISALLHLHPWALEVLSRLRPVGPNELAWTEAAVRALGDTGLDAAETLDTIFTLIGHVRVTAQYTARPAPGLYGLDPLDWAKGIQALIRKNAAMFPALARAEKSGGFEAESDGLEFGLMCILDGVEARIASSKELGSATGSETECDVTHASP